MTRASNSNNNTKGRRGRSVVLPSLISHGTALEPSRLRRTTLPRQQPQSDEGGEEDGSRDDDDLSELFVTMCFFARLGFDQPPSCLRCAYRDATTTKNNNSPTSSSSPIIDGTGDENNSSSSSGGGNTNNENNDDDDDTAKIGECHNLIPWRIDASILLHPARLTLPSPSSPPHDTAANDDINTNDKTSSSNATDDDDNNEENEEEENSGGSSSENGSRSSSSSSNIVFITCTTAQCLVNGECYPCLRYDGRNKRLLLF